MAEFVYLLCALTSLMCTGLLWRGYRTSRGQLLLWSSICFGLLAMNNVLLFIDLALFPELDFNGMFWRNLLAAGAGGALLYGLIWELT
jgi:hypothetical protein